EQGLRPHASDGLVRDVPHELLESPEAGGTMLEDAAPEDERADEIDGDGHRDDRPVEAGQQAVDPVGLQPARLVRQVVVVELEVGPVAAMVAEVAHALDGEGRGEEGGEDDACAVVDPARGMEAEM